MRWKQREERKKIVRKEKRKRERERRNPAEKVEAPVVRGYIVDAWVRHAASCDDSHVLVKSAIIIASREDVVVERARRLLVFQGLLFL